MTDYSSRIAAAASDLGALLALAIELAEECARLKERAVVLEAAEFARKSKQTERVRKSRERNATQRDVTLQSVTGTHETLPPSPLPSLSSPTPLINPSFPPSPLLPPMPQGTEEERLVSRAPEAWPTVVRFLTGKDDVARMAWIGRFHGALDRPPHPTGQELSDAIGDLMTEPRENWKPTMFRRFVERIRRDANRDAERAAQTTAGRPARALSAVEMILE